jgi:hypothetical protein
MIRKLYFSALLVLLFTNNTYSSRCLNQVLPGSNDLQLAANLSDCQNGVGAMDHRDPTVSNARE